MAVALDINTVVTKSSYATLVDRTMDLVCGKSTFCL
jgi:hypothetical protein